MSTTLEISEPRTPFRRLISWFKSTRGRNTVNGYIFIGPFILGVLFWVLIPSGTAAWLVFQDWNMIKPAQYVGLDNITRMFTGDPLFWKSLKVTSIFTFTSVPLSFDHQFFHGIVD